jgi:hypothetical protein
MNAEPEALPVTPDHASAAHAVSVELRIGARSVATEMRDAAS